MRESDPKIHGILEFNIRDGLTPEQREARDQDHERERKEHVVQYFCAVFAGYLMAHLDAERDYNEMRRLLPKLFGELVEQTFFQKWRQDSWTDRNFEYLEFRGTIDEQVSKSGDWLRFIEALERMARKAGDPHPPGNLPFTELVHPSEQSVSSGQVPSSSAGSERQVKKTDDFASVKARNSALADYVKHWGCAEAALARTARVDPADLSKWKKGALSGSSEKKTRIENVLRNNFAPTRIAKRSKD